MERPARKTHVSSDGFPNRAIRYLSYNPHQSDNIDVCAGMACSTVRQGRSNEPCTSQELIASYLFGGIADKRKLLKDEADERSQSDLRTQSR